MRNRLHVYVNDEALELPLGLKVRHAVGWRWARLVRARRALVQDAEGNQYDLGGALFDGQRLYVREVSEEQYWAAFLGGSQPRT